MGIYINTGNEGFRRARNSEYVDKSGLIAVVNNTLFSEARFTCVSRCRRFGKSMAAKMLCAYYDKSCKSRELFADLLLVGINYDKETKTHSCAIERWGGMKS
ncbi:MAG: AAA family ATPase [Prevotella sp.]|nr:AAA family ATPase [Prevotella sp.]